MLTNARILVILAFAFASLALPAAADAAALSGENGIIFFTSGRGGAAGNDSEAKIYGRTILSSTGLGSVLGPFTTTTGKQHKHSAISPDRKTLAFSRGTPGTFLTEDFDIFLLDLDTGIEVPVTTPGDGITSDRPAFSPDGKYLAYDNEVGTNDTGQRDIYVRDLAAGTVTNLTNTPSIVEGKAAWTPDSQTIYYQSGNPTGTNTLDIKKRSLAGGGETQGVPDSGISEFQPSISPDGSKICFTLGDGFTSNTTIMVALTASPATQTVINTGSGGNINCVFSPDGTLIAYTNGVFTSGGLVMERADGTDLVPIGLSDEPAHFDGNADWAPDGLPVCFDATVTTARNKPVLLPLRCEDTGPKYERTALTALVTGNPANGKVGEESPGSPTTVLYTPNPGFVGADKVTFRGFDAHTFAPGSRTITVNVVPDPPELSQLRVQSSIPHKNKKPRLSTKKKGTTISFRLSEPAAVTLSFKRIGTLKNKRTSGKFTVNAKAGLSRVVFFGKTSATKSLYKGKYKVTVVAVDPDGEKSPARTRRFTLK